MQNLRKLILKEIKSLLNEAPLPGESALIGKMKSPGIQSVERLKAFSDIIDNQIQTLKSAGRDTQALETILNNAKSMKDFNAETAMKELANARMAARDAAAVETGATGAAAGATSGEVKAAGEAGAAAGAVTPEVKAAKEKVTAASESGDFSNVSAQEAKLADSTGASKIKNVTDEQIEAEAKRMLDNGATEEEVALMRDNAKKMRGKLRWDQAWQYAKTHAQKCKKSKTAIGICITAVLGMLGYGAYKLAGGGSTPTPVTPPGGGDVGGGGTAGGGGTPTASTGGTLGAKGRSFKCNGDTAQDSIVAKFQRHVGIFPDGEFGKNTFNAGIKKGIKFSGTWEQYKANSTDIANLCSWLKQPGQDWAKLDGTVKTGGKGGKSKKPGQVGGEKIKLNTTINKDADQEVYKDRAARLSSEMNGYQLRVPGQLSDPDFVITIRTDTDEDTYQDIIERNLLRALEVEGISSNRMPSIKFEVVSEEKLQESWHKKHQTTYTTNLFERLVKSVNNRKVM